MKLSRDVLPHSDRQLHVLLSAYACEPEKGSEPGVGWRWALNLAASGHTVHVITRSNNRAAIEHAMREQGVPRLYPVYYDLPWWARWWKRGGRGVHLYYLLWQWGAFLLARRLHRVYRFDVAHHITFGVFRQPSFMAFLGLPFVFGPVGGGETAPPGLRRSFPALGRLRDFARDLANSLVRLDPLMHSVFRRSAIILCKTRETLEAIPSRYRAKCRLQLEIGAAGFPMIGTPAPGRQGKRGLRVLYVGRLVYLKGMHLALPAFAQLLREYPDARFTVVGDGPEQPRLQQLAQRLDIVHALDWVPCLSHREVLAIYAQHDLLLFPSLHDSSGNAVLEALAGGVPVVCLNLGGPGVLVDEQCGIRVRATDEDGAIAGLAQALQTLAADEPLRRRMAAAAMLRARTEYSWHSQTRRMNRIYVSALASSPALPEAVS